MNLPRFCQSLLDASFSFLKLCRIYNLAFFLLRSIILPASGLHLLLPISCTFSSIPIYVSVHWTSIQPENTHHIENHHCTYDLLFIVFAFGCLEYVEWTAILLVCSNTNQDVSRTVILPHMVSVLWFNF